MRTDNNEDEQEQAPSVGANFRAVSGLSTTVGNTPATSEETANLIERSTTATTSTFTSPPATTTATTFLSQSRAHPEHVERGTIRRNRHHQRYRRPQNAVDGQPNLNVTANHGNEGYRMSTEKHSSVVLEKIWNYHLAEKLQENKMRKSDKLQHV